MRINVVRSLVQCPQNALVWVLALLAVTWAANPVVRCIIRFAIRRAIGYKTEDEKRKADAVYEQVIWTGPITGVLERAIVFVFAILGQFSAIAWVMVAKGFIIQTFSSYREGGASVPAKTGHKGNEETDKTVGPANAAGGEKDKKALALAGRRLYRSDPDFVQTVRESYLVGTFASFLFAIVIGVLAANILEMLDTRNTRAPERERSEVRTMVSGATFLQAHVCLTACRHAADGEESHVPSDL